MGLTIIRRASPDDGDITILMTITSTYTLGDSETLPVSTPTSSKSTSIVYKTTTLVTSVTSKRSSTTTSSTFDHSSSLESSMFETETEDSSPISSNISNSSPSPSASNIALTLDRDVDGSGKSTKLGLAVGLPVSIFAVFLFVALGFFLLKRKLDKKMLEYENEYYSYPPDTVSYTHLDVYKRQGWPLWHHPNIPNSEVSTSCTKYHIQLQLWYFLILKPILKLIHLSLMAI